MNSDIKTLQTSCIEACLKLALTGIALSMIWLDIVVFKTNMLEMSFVEISQETMLFLCAVLFFAGTSTSDKKGFSILVGGFFACLLMRELDGLLDPISHSAWCWPFTAIATVSVALAFNKKNRQGTLIALASFARTRVFGTMTTGLSILVFSRILGMGDFWHLVLSEGYMRLAKTTVEEGIELLTYSMWLAASIEHFTHTQITKKRSVTREPELSSFYGYANSPS
ncbi:hypothetical protein [Pseudomonas sp. URMO17WK12:I12]|uniref:hypothetical protein n=1 Tax=Pseudomonas sp. URMO17WK12:I12 TaxID=1259797 RepID=UPI00067E6C51|nr:hypothetical protein [Pseudomonas sp. URMO17WK12:I12]